MWPDGKAETYQLHCFADQEDAQAFIDEFGGVHFDPKREPGKGKLRGRWVRSDEWQPVTRSVPLRVPAVLIGKAGAVARCLVAWALCASLGWLLI
jgi:hypothetical protein